MELATHQFPSSVELSETIVPMGHTDFTGASFPSEESLPTAARRTGACTGAVDIGGKIGFLPVFCVMIYGLTSAQ